MDYLNISKALTQKKIIIYDYSSAIQLMKEKQGRINFSLDASRNVFDLILRYKPVLSKIEPIKLPDQEFLSLGFDTQFSSIIKEMQVNIKSIRSIFFDLNEMNACDRQEKKSTLVIDNTKTLIKSIYDDNDLLKIIDPIEFEKVVAELLHNRGYDVELTKKTRDGGYDILALTKVGGIPFKMLVECKRYKNKVGIEVIRSFCDVVNTEKANKGLIFTTSYYSQPVLERSNKEGSILDLKDKDDLINWVIKYLEIKG